MVLGQSVRTWCYHKGLGLGVVLLGQGVRT